MKKTSHSTPYFFEIKGQNTGAAAALPVVIKRRKGARSLVLRYQPLKHALTLTVPPYVSARRGLQFIEEKRGWIMAQLAKKPETVPFADGQVIPVMGREYRLKHVGGRGVVRITPPPNPLPQGEGVILVPGDAIFMARRVREWLKIEAREAITRLAQEKAGRIGKRVKKITLRDTHSLWGSCNKKGHLSFSWRLVFAPPEVLDYLVAHEVAHLQELNHSAAFWRLVAELCPQWEESRRWLKRHGDSLYAYG